MRTSRTPETTWLKATKTSSQNNRPNSGGMSCKRQPDVHGNGRAHHRPHAARMRLATPRRTCSPNARMAGTMAM
jgi:hypothetical protein